MSSEHPTPSSPVGPKTSWETFDDLYDSICNPLMIIPQVEKPKVSPENFPPAKIETWEPVYQRHLNVQEYYEAFISPLQYKEYRKHGDHTTKWEFWTGLRPELQEEVSPEQFDDVHHMKSYTKMKEMILNRLHQIQQRAGTSSKEKPGNGSLEKGSEELIESQKNETESTRPSPEPRKRGRPRGSKSKSKRKGTEREFGEDTQMRMGYF